MIPLRAGIGTLLNAGCRAVTGPVPRATLHEFIFLFYTYIITQMDGFVNHNKSNKLNLSAILLQQKKAEQSLI